MFALVLTTKKRKKEIIFCVDNKALNKALARNWRVRATAQVLEIYSVKNIKALAVKGLWHTKTL